MAVAAALELPCGEWGVFRVKELNEAGFPANLGGTVKAMAFAPKSFEDFGGGGLFDLEK